MKVLSVLVLITAIFGMGCSSNPVTSRNLEKRVQEFEVYSLQEIQQHTQLLLDSHPELSQQARKEIKLLLEQSILRWQEQRKKEAQIIQALLSRSLGPDVREGDSEIVQMQRMLRQVYDEKHADTLKLLGQVNELGAKKLVDKRFEKDLNLIIREFR